MSLLTSLVTQSSTLTFQFANSNFKLTSKIQCFRLEAWPLVGSLLRDSGAMRPSSCSLQPQSPLLGLAVMVLVVLFLMDVVSSVSTVLTLTASTMKNDDGGNDDSDAFGNNGDVDDS